MDNAINFFEGSRFEIDYNNARIVIDLGMRKGKGKGDDPKDGTKDDEKGDKESLDEE